MGAMAEIALLLGVGFVLRKARFLSDAVQAGCMELMIKIVVPAQVLASAASVVFNADIIRDTLLLILLTLLGYIVSGALGFAASRALGLSNEERAGTMGTLMFRNTFMGLPICIALFGQESLFYAMFPVVLFNIVMFSFGVSLYSQGRTKGLSAIAKNPSLICCAIMILLVAFQVRLPVAVQSTLSRLVDAAIPISLIVVGMMLADGDMSAILKNRIPWAVSALSLIIFPLLMLLLILLIKPGMDAAAVLLTFSVLPSGAINPVIAKQYGTGAELVPLIVLHTMLASLVVIPFGLPLLLQAIGYWG